MKSVFTDEYNIFLAHLIESRKSSGLTQSDVANRINKPQSFVSKYERKERRLDVIEFIVVCRAIGIDPNVIVTDIENRLSVHSEKDVSV